MQKFGATWFVDLEAIYQFTEELGLTLGGRNIFDEYPDEIDRSVNGNDYCCGRLFASTAVVPWQGGYYYMRLRLDM